MGSFDTKLIPADGLAYHGHRRRLAAASGWIRAQLADGADPHSLVWGGDAPSVFVCLDFVYSGPSGVCSSL